LAIGQIPGEPLSLPKQVKQGKTGNWVVDFASLFMSIELERAPKHVSTVTHKWLKK
jgi:hypothetical protein